MVKVTISPDPGNYIEFVRLSLLAEDDGLTSPPTVEPYEILYTTDGSIPSDSNSATKVRRSPIQQLPISKPTTIKFFARSLTFPVAQTPIQVAFYDLTELTAKNTVLTVNENIRNYTLTINTSGDLVRTSPGRYDVIFGVDKTKQDIREIILVEDVAQGQPVGDRTLPRFGSALNRILGENFPIGFAESEIRSSLFDALSTLIQLQRDERVPNNEQISRIIRVAVAPLDPTTFTYEIIVQTVAGEQVSDRGTIVGA